MIGDSNRVSIFGEEGAKEVLCSPVLNSRANGLPARGRESQHVLVTNSVSMRICNTIGSYYV